MNMSMDLRLEHTMEIRQDLLKHLPFENALKGTRENVEKVAAFLSEKGMTGLLWGGCSYSDKLNRRDIDVILLDGEVERFEEGVDWWVPKDSGYVNGNECSLYFLLRNHKLPIGLTLSPKLARLFFGKPTKSRYMGIQVSDDYGEIDYLPDMEWEDYGDFRMVKVPCPETEKIFPNMKYDVQGLWFEKRSYIIDDIRGKLNPGLSLLTGTVKIGKEIKENSTVNFYHWAYKK